MFKNMTEEYCKEYMECATKVLSGISIKDMNDKFSILEHASYVCMQRHFIKSMVDYKLIDSTTGAFIEALLDAERICGYASNLYHIEEDSDINPDF